MPPKIIKLGKKDDIASVVKVIKNLKDREVVFELEKGSLLLKNSDNLKLMKRTAEVLGKKIMISTDDEIGKVLAKKVGVLSGDNNIKMPKSPTRFARSDAKPKFSDILLPRTVVNRVKAGTQKAFESSGLPSLSLTAPKLPSIRNIKLKNFNTKAKYWVSGLVGLVIICLALAILLPQATIIVFARSEPISRDFEITVDQNVSVVDTDKLVIPGLAITKEVSETKNFPTTGSNSVGGTKATGTVTLYNFTANTIKLKQATTTLTANGHKYFFAKDVTGIKPNPATIDVGIVAEAGGSAYNLPVKTKFTIVNAALGNQNVYAINSAAISNGTDGVAAGQKVLTQSDLDQALASLTQDVIHQAESDLSAEKGIKYRILDSGVKKEILAHTANKNVGDAVDSFDMTLIARVTGIAFSERNLTNLLDSKINEVLSSDKYLVSETANQYTANFKSLDLNAGKGTLTVHFQTNVAYKIDTASLAKLLAGKTESEIKEILLSKPEVDSVTVQFWPSALVHKAPVWNGKVYVKSELTNSN